MPPAPRKKPITGKHGGRPINKGAAIALQALKAGNCEPGRQQMLAKWLVDWCGVHAEPTNTSDSNATFYELGRRSVGLDIIDHATVNIGMLNDETETKA